MVKVAGVYTAMITPFLPDGSLDEEGLHQNIAFQLSHEIDGLVPLGTTGEAPTLNSEEKKRVIQLVVQQAKHKTKIMVGTGSYSTQQTIENTQEAADLGADMVLIVSPYYNKPTQQGLYRHFKTVADSTSIPIMVYNIAGRTGQNIQTDTLKRIAEHPRIIGVKESSGNPTQVGEIIEQIKHHRPDFSVMSGDDANTLWVMSLGGDGIISVISNLVPYLVKALVEEIQKGDFQAAREKHYHLLPLVRGAFLETNPIPIKAAMSYFGMSAGGCRLPLCELSSEYAQQLREIVRGYSYVPVR